MERMALSNWKFVKWLRCITILSNLSVRDRLSLTVLWIRALFKLYVWSFASFDFRQWKNLQKIICKMIIGISCPPPLIEMQECALCNGLADVVAHYKSCTVSLLRYLANFALKHSARHPASPVSGNAKQIKESLDFSRNLRNNTHFSKLW